MGAGGESKSTFDAYGVPMNERGRRCDEMLELMYKLWTEESVTHHGRFWSLENYGIGAKPTQRPAPADLARRGQGGRPGWSQRAARWADGIYPSRVSPSELTGVYERIFRYADEIGRDMSHFTKAVLLKPLPRFEPCCGPRKPAAACSRNVIRRPVHVGGRLGPAEAANCIFSGGLTSSWSDLPRSASRIFKLTSRREQNTSWSLTVVHEKRFRRK